MAITKYNARVVQKHDTKANWDKATNFIPLKGEIIVYDDLKKIKIGDGVTKVGSLAFVQPTPADIGLGNVNNTSDANKPISSATQAALNQKLSLSGGTLTGKIDLTTAPNANDGQKMGKTSGASGGIHLRKNGSNDEGNAITWSYTENDEAHAGIYVKSSGSYGTKMYLATTNLFDDGAKAALEIDSTGKITALRNNFVGNLTGNASSATKATQDASGNTITSTYATKNELTTTQSNLQSSINAKQATITGAATTITSSNLTANRALVSNSSGKVAVSAVTSTELGYLDGVTSNVQTQLDGKLPKSGGTVTGTLTLSKNQDLSGTANNSPALIIGTSTSAEHIEFDSNEIQAKSNGTTPSTLNLNNDGGAVSVGSGGITTSGNISASGKITGNIPEAYLSWGGKNFAGSYGCVDAAMIPHLGANRLAFMPAAGVTVEYSTDGGSTWATYSTSDSSKINLFNGNGASYHIGASTATGIDKSKYMLRVTIETGTAKVYTTLNKFVIYCSTSDSSGCYCTITARTQANYAAGTDTWVTFANKVDITGWSGYNIINTSSLTTYGNTSSHYRQVRFTFGVTSHASTSQYSGLSISKIMGFGGVGWVTPSTMATNGHMYTYDASKNVTFPAGVTATTFTGSLSGNATSATSANKLNNYYSTRPTSCNIPVTGDGSIKTFKATSAMATGKPMADGHVIHSEWDSNGGYSVQLYIPHSNTDSMQYRGMMESTWGAWKTLIDSSTIGSQSVNYATSAGSATSASKCTGNAATATNVAWSGVTSKPSYYDAKAIKSITRSGTTFTYTCMDGTTGTFTQQDNNTTYSAATSSALGLVKIGSNISNSSGTISLTKANVTAALGYTPPTTDTTYSAATQSAAGLMSAADKTKLDGVASGANAYSLPTASSSTLGGVKTTSTVTSASGLTPCPIISGVPYYNGKDLTNAEMGFGYGLCSTAAATAEKTVVLDDYVRRSNGTVSIYFTYNVPANATLNINSKGAKLIKYKGVNITAGTIKAGDIATFIYEGSYYRLLSIDRWQKDITEIQTELDNKAPAYTYGTTDLTAGTSSLTTGTLYFVYE